MIDTSHVTLLCRCFRIDTSHVTLLCRCFRCSSNTTEDGSDSDVETCAVEGKRQIKEKENGKKVKSNKKERDKKKRKRKHKDMPKNNEQKLMDEHFACESDGEQTRVKKKKKKRKK